MSAHDHSTGPRQQLRHKPPTILDRPRELVVACEPLRSNVNLSRIARTAGCCAVPTLICCGNAKIIDKIARDAIDDDEALDQAGLEIRVHRTLLHPLLEFERAGYHLVGLEQTGDSQSLFDYRFERKTVLVVGNERSGISEEVLSALRDVVEIPIYGRPHALNAATAAAMAMYEYCRQFPRG